MPTRACIHLALLAGCAARGPQVAQGPLLGHVDTDQALVWARLDGPGEASCRVRPEGGEGPWREFTADAAAEGDLCVRWTLSGLEPATAYRYEVAGGSGGRFETAPDPGVPARVTIAFGSCADEDAGTSRVWDAIAARAPDAFVALGDTPYINSTDLAVQRRRYAEFTSVPAMQAALASCSFYATWDDHDYGRQDVDGRMPGKADARQAFVEFHANPSYGDGAAGVYTSFRRGPIEVFLLDTRWFARTAPSAFDRAQPTLLGDAQWRWLYAGLRASDAPFKVLACGMVWNGAVRPGKTDHWAAYELERRALFAFIGRRRISGVTLVGGDVHRSRVIRHPTRGLAGYDLTELITSPMHERVLEIASVPHLGLVWDRGEPNTFLLLEADSTVEPATLTALFIDDDGTVLHELSLSAADLQPSEQ